MKTGTAQTAREIVARSGSNLAFALGVLPPEKRSDMKVFYAFCRVLDDLSDAPGLDLNQRQSGLDHWRELTAGASPRPGIEAEFVQLKEKYHFDSHLLNELIDGVAMDLEPHRFQTVDDLKRYCFRVASAVGLLSIEIFGYKNANTPKYAENLGYALQLTNIMRDVGEDAANRRVYLPLKDLAEFGIQETEIIERRAPVAAFEKLMAHHSQIARHFYDEATRHLADEDKSSMRSPELMRRIYFGILQKMEKDNYRVFEKRYRLSKMRMLTEFLRAKFLT